MRRGGGGGLREGGAGPGAGGDTAPSSSSSSATTTRTTTTAPAAAAEAAAATTDRSKRRTRSRGGDDHDGVHHHRRRTPPPTPLLALLLAALLLLATTTTTAKTTSHQTATTKSRPTSSAWGRWRRSPPPPSRPSARLFHDDEGSLAWDAPALKRLRQAARGDHLRDLDAFLRAPSLAAFLGLDPVQALHVPLPVNVVLVGFQGDGHVNVDLPAAVIKEWLARGLDHVLPHTRVALAELSCAEDGHCLGRLDASAVSSPSPLPSVVRLNASVTVAAVAKGEVLAAFDRAIAAFSRPTDPAEPMGAQQVDALKMDAFVESFVEALGFADSGYTLLVLNPNWSSSLAAYSYRAGFTTEEIEQLHGQLDLLHEVSAQAPQEEPSMPRLRPPPLKRPGVARLGTPSRGDNQLSAAAREAAAARFAIATGQGGSLGSWKKFRAVDAGEASAVWAKAAKKYLEEEEEHRRALIRLIGPRTLGGAAAARAVSLLRQAQGHGRWALPGMMMGGGGGSDTTTTQPTSSVASRYAEEGRLLAATLSLPPDHVHNPDLRASHPLEDCATPTWVGLGRWILLDLTAHRADWGPALGGDGVVTSNTLPDVAEALAPVIAVREDVRDSRVYTDAEVALHEKLEHDRDASRSRVQNAQAHAEALSQQQQQQNAAPPPQPQPTFDANGNPILTADTVVPPAAPLPHESDHDRAQRESRNEAAVLRAELDAVERFAIDHCHGRPDPPPACEDAREAAAEIWHELLLRSTTAGHSVHGGHRDHHWDIFGDLALAGEQHAAVMAPAVKRAAGRLLPHLAAVLSSGLRHAVAPPSATWHHRGYLHDTASPYARRVRFRVHLVRDGTRQAVPGTRAHEKLGMLTGRAPGGGGGGFSGSGTHSSLARPPPFLSLSSFDVGAFKQQVGRLALPKQRFEFEVVEVNLHDEPGLAAAFAASTRGAFASVPHAVDDPVESEAVYVDSRELAARLRARFGGPNARGLAGGGVGGGAGGGPALRKVHFNADADPTGFFGGGADVWTSSGARGRSGGPGGAPASWGAKFGSAGGDEEDSAAADGFGGGSGGEDDNNNNRQTTTNPHAVLDVPVFVFVLDRPHPVLLDAHYNARALEDMVLAVSNSAHEDEPPLGVSCDGYLLSRPPSPLRHTLAAVLQHLGGVLPPHLGYRPASSATSPYDDAAGDESDGGAGLLGGDGGGGGGVSADNGGASSTSTSTAYSSESFAGGRIEHDWLWATGAHPLAWTGSGASYSQLSVDALHRSYVLDALDASVDVANRAMRRLDAADARRRRVAAAQVLLEAEKKRGGGSATTGDGNNNQKAAGDVPSLLEEWADALAAGDERGMVPPGTAKSGKDRARRRRRAASLEKHGGELLLEREHAHLLSHASLARRALEAYSDLAELWRRSAAHAAALDFGSAAEAIPRIERAAYGFERACAELEEALFPKRCAARHGRGLPPGLKWGVVWGVAFGGAAVASLALGLPRYLRLKIVGKHAKGA